MGGGKLSLPHRSFTSPTKSSIELIPIFASISFWSLLVIGT
jgi:hypothetical protein